KNIPRRIATFAVYPRISSPDSEEHAKVEPLDHTMQLPSRSKIRTAGAAWERRASYESPVTTFPVMEPAPVQVPTQPNFDPPPVAQSTEVSPQQSEVQPQDAVPLLKEPAPQGRRASLSALGEPLTAEAIAFFGDSIAVHLGPVGRVMTARKAKSCATLGE